MKIEARTLIKQMANHLQVWDKVVDQLVNVRALSEKNEHDVQAAIVAESPVGFVNVCDSAWLVLYAIYNRGNLRRTDAVVVIAYQEADHQYGSQVAEGICGEFCSGAKK